MEIKITLRVARRILLSNKKSKHFDKK